MLFIPKILLQKLFTLIPFSHWSKVYVWNLILTCKQHSSGLLFQVLEGYNATVFAYGQTGYRWRKPVSFSVNWITERFRCGKSYTMQGVNTPGSPQRGVIPRSFEVSRTAPVAFENDRYIPLLLRSFSIFSKPRPLQRGRNTSFVLLILKSTMKVFVTFSAKMWKLRWTSK